MAEEPERRTVLGFELSPLQDAYINYLLPSVVLCLFYILHFAADVVATQRHFHDGNPVWASLTLFFVYLPVLGCFVITISSWELWPQYEGCGGTNVKWALLKIAQHLFFPVWSMWRYAEKIFWSIEGIRSEDEESRKEALETVRAPRTIEFYYFLQGYLQAVPQILLQMHILFWNGSSNFVAQTVNVQVMSIVLNLACMAMITTFYQRFKSQKLAGRQYPWFKSYKQVDYIDGSCGFGVFHKREAPGEDTARLEESFEQEATSSRLLERRSSSDSYLQPIESPAERKQNRVERFKKSIMTRATSIFDGPERVVYKEDERPGEVDLFNIPRVVSVKGLLEDDLVGKFVAFMWWFCFILARMLAISAFAYFYPTHVIWLLASHFILAVALLLYDVKADEVRRAKAIFFIFIGLVYLFVLIEFKIRFKKAKFICYGFFALVFVENVAMCSVWWFGNVEEIDNDWWYKYVFYVIVGSICCSFLSMMVYLRVNKPKKVVVAQIKA